MLNDRVEPETSNLKSFDSWPEVRAQQTSPSLVFLLTRKNMNYINYMKTACSLEFFFSRS